MATSLRDALYEAQRSTRGGWAPTPSNVPSGMAIDNARPVNPLQWTGGNMPPEAPNWSTSRGATPEPARAPGRSLALSGPGLAERQPTRVPLGASSGVAPAATPVTPNLPATVPGQGATFQGNGARPNFTTVPPTAPAPPAYDAEVTQRAKSMAASRQAAGGMNAGANQGVSAGVQGRVGPEPMARPGVVDLRGGNAGQGGGKGYEVARKAGSLLHGSSVISKVAPALGKAAGGAGVVENFNDYKIDDPSVDSSASGTFNALRQGDFAGAGRSLSKGALETGMDLGSYAANTADILVPGQPFSQGYNKMLRGQFGDQLIDNSGNGAAAAPATAPATPTVPAAPGAPTRPLNRMGQGFDDPRRVDRDPSRQNLGASRDFTNELAGAPKNLPAGLREGVVYKTKDANGRTVYSGANISGNIQMVDGVGRDLQTRGDVNTVPGMSKEAISRTLTNPDGSKWSANDNAIMAANLRDGIDPYRGTSRGNAQAQGGMSAGMASIAAAEQKLGVPLGKARRAQAAIDQQGAIAERTNQTTLRGQDMELEGRLAPKRLELEMAQRMRQLNAGIYQQSGGDPRKAQEIALSMGMDGKAFGDLADANQTRSDKSRAQTKDLLAPLSVAQNEKGEDVISPAKQAQREALVRQMLPQFESGTPDQKALDLRQLAPAVNLVDAANARRSNGFWQQLPGWVPGAEAPTPEASTLPDFAPGVADTVDGAEGLFTGGGVGKGDYKVPLKGGGYQYLDRSKIGKAELDLLNARGVTLRGAN